ncbi:MULTISPECIES: CRISPR DNA repeat-binding protein Cbp1 [Metallosphaera]|uniref:Resolvase domain-containing protein n=1 Tax=Metallosphaera cuprina (strain Ar-4) TaxID=1006006 RepID=F4FYA1_METCR|nr:resolvase domain-containing protein [Metallosphaera cuprina Ar-4]
MNEDIVEKAKKMYEDGRSIRDIAKELSLSYSKTRRILKERGVIFRGKTPPDLINQVIEYGKQGYSANKISKLLKMNSNTVLRILKKHNLVKGKRKLTQEKIQKIKDMYKNGYSIYKIAKELDISTNLVVYYLKKLQLKN